MRCLLVKIKIRVTKLYLAEIIDEEGNSLDCDYVFGDKAYAEQVAKQMKKDYINKEKDYFEKL